jgi:hypothetical protein
MALIALWVVWAFAGWRLYIELPRVAGPVIWPAKPSTSENILGTYDVDDMSAFVALSTPRNRTPSAVRVFDPLTGKARNRWPLPFCADRAGATLSPRQGMLLFTYSLGGNVSEFRPHVLDLHTGQVKRLECADAHSCASIHPTRPWAALAARLPNDPPTTNRFSGTRVLVFDLRTGELVGALPPADAAASALTAYYNPNFLPGGDLIAVNRATRMNELDSTPDVALEIWRVPFGARPERKFLDCPFPPIDAAFSSNMRAAWSVSEEGITRVEALELTTGKLLLSEPPRASRKKDNGPPGPGWARLTPLTADGRTIVDRDGKRVLDIETGRELSHRDLHYARIDLERSAFEIRNEWTDFSLARRWNALAGAWFPSHKLNGELYSVMDLRTGDLLYRCDGPSLQCFSNDKADHDLRPLQNRPPNVRWARLAAIQVGLATPILILHFVVAASKRRRSSHNSP